MSLSTHPSHCNCAREVGGGRASARNPRKAGPLPFPALIGSAAATAAGAAYLLVPALINVATCIAVLSLFFSLPLFVGFVMADFFTPIPVLVIYLIGFRFSTLSSLEKACFMMSCIQEQPTEGVRPNARENGRIRPSTRRSDYPRCWQRSAPRVCLARGPGKREH